jgi:hypothetical protein
LVAYATNLLSKCDRFGEGGIGKLEDITCGNVIHLFLHVLKFVLEELQAARKAQTISWSSSSVVFYGIKIFNIKQSNKK